MQPCAGPVRRRRLPHFRPNSDRASSDRASRVSNYGVIAIDDEMNGRRVIAGCGALA
jgi:hypothetical protein